MVMSFLYGESHTTVEMQSISTVGAAFPRLLYGDPYGSLSTLLVEYHRFSRLSNGDIGLAGIELDLISVVIVIFCR